MSKRCLACAFLALLFLPPQSTLWNVPMSPSRSFSFLPTRSPHRRQHRRLGHGPRQLCIGMDAHGHGNTATA